MEGKEILTVDILINSMYDHIRRMEETIRVKDLMITGLMAENLRLLQMLVDAGLLPRVSEGDFLFGIDREEEFIPDFVDYKNGTLYNSCSTTEENFDGS